MELIETHCHLDLEPLWSNFGELVDRARLAGVSKFVLPGVTSQGWPRLLQLAQTITGCYCAPGLHPLYLAHHRHRDWHNLETLLADHSVTALGEIGLDYLPEDIDHQAQQLLFEFQLDLAAVVHRPVLLHIRKAHDRVLATLRRKRFQYGGIVHAFSGSLQQARQFIDLGFVIGVCGTITYDRAQKIRRIVTSLDKNALVLETDAPDIPLAGLRNGPNRPEYLINVLQCLAELRSESIEELAETTTANASRILQL